MKVDTGQYSSRWNWLKYYYVLTVSERLLIIITVIVKINSNN